MTTATRRALGLSVAVVGAALALLGLWLCVTLGPSGEAAFSARLSQTGALAVEPKVLNALDVPAEVSVTRADGGPLWVGLAGQSDASAVVRDAKLTTVDGVSWPSGAVSTQHVGASPLPDLTQADVWRVSTQARGTARVVVPQGEGPETLIVSSQGGAPLADVDVTISWHHKTWFFLSLLLLVIGALLAAGAGFFVWQDFTAPAAPEPGATSRSSRHRQRLGLPRLPLPGRDDAEAGDSTGEAPGHEEGQPTDAKGPGEADRTPDGDEHTDTKEVEA